MKPKSLIATIVIASSFIAGIFVADYIRPDRLSDKAPQTLSAENLLGKMSPAFTLTDTSGVSRNISEWQNLVLAINFWATWCPPCKKEIPHFIELQNKYGTQGLQFLGIAIDKADKVHTFAEQMGINYPLLLGQHEVISIAKKFGNHTGGLPYTVILNRSGHISFIKQGVLSMTEAEQVITQLL